MLSSLAGRKAAADVGERYVGYGSVQQLHEGGESDGQRDKPGIDGPRSFAIVTGKGKAWTAILAPFRNQIIRDQSVSKDMIQ